MNITLVTGNANKLREYQDTLKGIRIESLDIDLPELQGTIEEIVKAKSRLAAEKTKKACFVDDTSLCFNAFGGLPGPYIKSFIQKMSLDDISKMLDSFQDRTAVAKAGIGFCEPGKDPIVIIGEVKGNIVPPRGETNFGWDPIFQPDGSSLTFAEMNPEEKKSLSHRRMASVKFKEFLQEKFKD